MIVLRILRIHYPGRHLYHRGSHASVFILEEEMGVGVIRVLGDLWLRVIIRLHL